MLTHLRTAMRNAKTYAWPQPQSCLLDIPKAMVHPWLLTLAEMRRDETQATSVFKACYSRASTVIFDMLTGQGKQTTARRLQGAALTTGR